MCWFIDLITVKRLHILKQAVRTTMAIYRKENGKNKK